jgi:hypothetical protein
VKSAAPSGRLVKWAGVVCESTIALRDLRAESAEDVEEIRDSDRAGDMFAQALVGDPREGCMALA